MDSDYSALIRTMLVASGIIVKDVRFNDEDQRIEFLGTKRGSAFYREFSYAEIRNFFLGHPPDSPPTG